MSLKDKEKDKERPESVDTLEQLVVVVDFIKILPKLWIWFLILVTLCSGISYYNASSSYYPIYTAHATFTVNIKKEQTSSNTLAFYDNAAAEQMVQTFPYILTSSLLHRMVEEDMGMAVTGTINAELEAANFLKLSVTDKDPRHAYDTLQSVIDNYPEVSELIVGKVQMNQIDHSGVPSKPSNPKVFTKEIINGALIGFGIGLGWAVLVFLTNRTIKKESDIKKKIGIEHIALGSDFDGIDPNIELKDAAMMLTLIDALSSAGLTDDEIDKITYQNALRVFRDNLR